MNEEGSVLSINRMQSETGQRSIPYNATRLQNWQISELAEEHVPTQTEWTERLGLEPNEVIPIGRLCKLDFLRIMERLKDHPDGKYIEVAAITPVGEGKSPTALGLIGASPVVPSMNRPFTSPSIKLSISLFKPAISRVLRSNSGVIIAVTTPRDGSGSFTVNPLLRGKSSG